ncbi:MAG TPA: hypothetical protein DEV87_06225 [Clostridiales bacterium]|nr:hypothetical protein [Clostridiales bacterium]
MRQFLDDAFLRTASDILGETNQGFFTTHIIDKCNSYAVDFNIQIPISSLDAMTRYKIPNKRTALYKNLRCFNATQQYRIISDLCDEPSQKARDDVKDLKIKLVQRFPDIAPSDFVESIAVTEAKHWLSAFPDALALYNSALAKYSHGVFERNVLDDMRLSLELLLKGLLHNDKSLENQIPELGAFLKAKGIQPEIRNMYTTLLKYYLQYQNNHVKHNDEINPNEMEYIIDLTSLFMKFLSK